MTEGLTLLFWIVVIGFGVQRIKNTESFPPFIDRLLHQKFITKAQAIQIRDFEKEERIKKWLKHKLITSEQAEIILNPKAINKHPSFWGQFSFITAVCYLAVGSILLGIIALVAANYDKIPPAVRAMSTLLWLLIVSWGCFYAYLKQKTILKEILIVAGIGMIGANIATVSQWFQLSGKPENALFVWAVLSLCFITLSEKVFWGFLWYPTILITGGTSDYGRPIFDFLVTHVHSEITAVMGIATLFLFLNRWAQKHPMTQAFKIWGLISTLILFVGFDGSITYRPMIFPIVTDTTETFKNVLMLVIFSLCPCIYAYQKKSLMIPVWGVAILGLITCLVRIPILGIGMSLFVLSNLAVWLARRNDLRAFNFVLIVIFLRLVGAYFHLFASLAKTGIGFIILGILILIGVRLYSKYKIKLIQYIQKSN